MRNNSGVYKFVYGSSSARHTVLRSATDLMLDAMREMDESAHHSRQDESSLADPAEKHSPFTPLLGLADPEASPETAAIAAAIADFAANAQMPESATPLSEAARSLPVEEPSESSARLEAQLAEADYVFEPPEPGEQPAGLDSESLPTDGDRAPEGSGSAAEPPFANYSIVPYAGNDLEDIT